MGICSCLFFAHTPTPVISTEASRPCDAQWRDPCIRLCLCGCLFFAVILERSEGPPHWLFPLPLPLLFLLVIPAGDLRLLLSSPLFLLFWFPFRTQRGTCCSPTYPPTPRPNKTRKGSVANPSLQLWVSLRKTTASKTPQRCRERGVKHSP